MISTNIDGTGGGASQLLDLLSLVANPAVYEAKIKALQDATAQHKQFVEAIGPASEILKLREDAKADRQAAADELTQVKQDVADIKAEAKAEKAAVINAATQDAANKVAAAQAALDDAKAKQAALDAALADAVKAQTKAQAALAAAEGREKAAAAAEQAAAQAKADAEAVKAALLAKHQAFIQSL